MILRRRSAAALVVVALLLAACGTTVPDARSKLGLDQSLGQVPAGADTPGGAVPGDPITGDGTAAPSGTGGGTATGDPSGSGTGGSGTGGTGGTGGTSGAPADPAVARGVTASTITLGLAVAGGTDALAGSLGVSGAGTITAQDAVNAVLKDVNRSGGVLGRQVALQVHTFDAATALANPSQAFAEICTDFRDDRKVFALLFDLADPALRTCLADMGSPLILLGGVSSILSASAYAEAGGGFLYGVDAITSDRLAELFVQSLLDRSFTEPWNTSTGARGSGPVKLGLIHVDTPDQNALYERYAKELAKHGLAFAQTVTYPQNADDAVASSLSAVLKFRSQGITHVFGASAFFLRVAESQGYRPRYAYLPGLGALGVANAPAAQLKGAMSVGWTPISDVNGPQDPGDTPAAKQCRSVMQAGGLSTANRRDLQTMYAACDAVYAFRAALTAGKTASLSGLRQGYESLGGGFGPALTFGASLGANRHFGVDSVRDLAFDAGCACLKYTSGTNRS